MQKDAKLSVPPLVCKRILDIGFLSSLVMSKVQEAACPLFTEAQSMGVDRHVTFLFFMLETGAVTDIFSHNTLNVVCSPL